MCFCFVCVPPLCVVTDETNNTGLCAFLYLLLPFASVPPLASTRCEVGTMSAMSPRRLDPTAFPVAINTHPPSTFNLCRKACHVRTRQGSAPRLLTGIRENQTLSCKNNCQKESRFHTAEQKNSNLIKAAFMLLSLLCWFTCRVTVMSKIKHSSNAVENRG